MKERDEDEVCELREELERIVADGTEVWQRQQHAREVRYNEWDGQSKDGRKHAADLGVSALPFEGAPDSRIPLVDVNINDKVALVTEAFFRGQVQAVAVEPTDIENAANVTSMLRWLRDSEMRKELRVEVELAAQHMYADDPGLCIAEVKWWQDAMLQKRLVTFEELATMYVTGASNPDQVPQDDQRMEPAMLADFQDLASNKQREQEFYSWLTAAFPGVSDKALRNAVKELRKQGHTDLPVPVVRENRPSMQTLRYFDDIFFPIGTSDIQRSRTIHRREWLNEAELRERVLTQGWDADLVEEIIEKGRGMTLADYASMRTSQRGTTSLSGPGWQVNEHNYLFEIWWSYERRPDEDMGVNGIFCTIWNIALPKEYLKCELVDYKHGLYPFVIRTRERLGRQVTDSRGLGVPIETHQNEVKVQRDARGVHIQMLATPPSKVKASRGAVELILGPAAQNPVQRMDDWELVQLPDFTQQSVEMERTTKVESDEYCGRLVPGADPNRSALIQQRDVNNFSAFMNEVFEQIIELCQQYYSPAQLARITGADLASPLEPEDIRGRFDVLIEIDARDLNMEFAMKKLEACGKLLQFDSTGMIDRAPWLQVVASGIDPVLARKSMRPQANVTSKEVEATRAAVNQMSVGVEPDMPVQGINAQLRMQTLQQLVTGSPKLMEQAQKDIGFQKMLENYQKYLTQQIEQDKNKQVGRIGTAPLTDAPQSAG
jgi:hypothetical protein